MDKLKNLFRFNHLTLYRHGNNQIVHMKWIKVRYLVFTKGPVGLKRIVYFYFDLLLVPGLQISLNFKRAYSCKLKCDPDKQNTQG